MSLINNLPEYVSANVDQLLSEAILGASAMNDFVIQTGVKNVAEIALVDTDVILQDGATCGWSVSGDTVFTSRYITAPTWKVNQSWCSKVLQNSSKSAKVKIAAGTEELPFEAQIMSDITKKINLEAGKKVFLDPTNGIIPILLAEGGIAISGSTISAANVKAEVDAVYASIPDNVLDKAIIYMGMGTLRLYVMALQALNLYAGAPELGSNQIYYPGSATVIKGIAELNNTDYILALNPEHTFVGVDLEGDQEVFLLGLDEKTGEHYLRVEFNLGAQVAFCGENVVRYTA